jgi:hypothetical protein
MVSPSSLVRLGAAKPRVRWKTISHLLFGTHLLIELPQYLLEAGWAAGRNVVVCTQPRRVAATSVASRVATELGVVLGNEVSFTILNHVCKPLVLTGWLYHSV